MKVFFLLATTLLLQCQCLMAQAELDGSGGDLIYEQAAYDVTLYELTLKVDPSARSIAGTLRMEADMVLPADRIALDLDPRFTVESIQERKGEELVNLRFSNSGGGKRLFVELPGTYQAGETIELTVTYHGKPREAVNPPWDGGFVWSQTPSGADWIGVACQSDGAWIWWPNKDHPSDKADSVLLNFTLPENLVVASNGRLEAVSQTEPGWKTWRWRVSTPINNYNVTLNAAPYETISDEYRSVSGELMDITFWVLPEFLDQGEVLFPQFSEHLRFFEEMLGPYPFRTDKYGVAHTPYLGMEHQTIIAYGASFRNGSLFGPAASFDDLHHHELAHEWWGNLVTAWDWKDFWLHEGIGTYMQALYEEQLSGKEGYHRFMRVIRQSITNHNPVAPRESHSTVEMDEDVGNDVYYKGAWFLHTLRYYMGDDLFFESLRRFAYPEPDMENATDGSQVRFATTDDYLHLVNFLADENLNWIFEVYLRSARLPQLEVRQDAESLTLVWHTPENVPFNMPVDVSLNGELHRLTPVNGRVDVALTAGDVVEVDPDNWILKSQY